MTPVMRSLVAAVGALWIAVIMWDAFEAIVLPRRVTRRLRPARMFYRATGRGGAGGAPPQAPGGRRGNFLSLFRPPPLVLVTPAPAAKPLTPPPVVQPGAAATPDGEK